VLSRLLGDLHTAGILTEDLALPEDPDDLEATYRGLCRIPKEGARRRRIDFLTVPWQSRGAALLYYTVNCLCTLLTTQLICMTG
jgi:DNA polymerase lambda